MSQVIVPHDNFIPSRAVTRMAELDIEREAGFDRWRMSDITQPGQTVMAGIIIVTAPFFVFALLMTAAIFVSAAVTLFCLRALGGRL